MNNISRLIKIMAAALIVLFSLSACHEGVKDTSGKLSELPVATDELTSESGDDIQSAEQQEQTKNSDIQKEPDLQESSESAGYEKCINDVFGFFPGIYSYALHVYDSDIVISANNASVKAASIIKLFIMEYAYNLMAKGELEPDSMIGGHKISSLIESMITYSDNNSTNILIDEFSMEKINTFIASCGYSDTVLGRKMLDTAAAARGEENYTSVCDVMKFFDKIYEEKASYPYDEMLSVLKRQQISTKIRRYIPADVEIANKTGELSDTDNDAGIVFTPKGDFAFVCFTNGASPEPARDCIAKAAKSLYDEINK